MSTEAIKQSITADILLDGIPYHIDHLQRLLRQFDNRRQVIPFAELVDEGSYLVLERDRVAPEITTRPTAQEPIIIPAELLESRDRLQLHRTREFNLSCQNYNWGIYVVDEPLALRLAGALPHIEIGGTDFTVDWRLRELRETAEPWKTLRFTDMYETGNVFVGFYHLQTHQLYLPPADITELPEHVVLAETGNDLALDPVAVAREHHLHLAMVLLEYPYSSRSTATLKPLSESALPEMIGHNKKMKQQHQQAPTTRRRGRKL
ncbi:MAG: hypothetical protein JSU01_00655 [Bacteroidetes bacterium]|nr:hypothetical protein [Bacteroidota bacterium]